LLNQQFKVEKLKIFCMKYFGQLHYRTCAKAYKLIPCKIWYIFVVIKICCSCLPVLLWITSWTPIVVRMFNYFCHLWD